MELRRGVSMFQEQPSTVKRTTIKTILIVEDDQTNAGLFVNIIATETPHQALVARNSAEALSFIHYLKPHLLLIDYHLPDMNGIELYDHLYAAYHQEAIPTIITTADVPEKVLVHQIGDRKVMPLSKPFDVDDLLRMITQMIA